MEFSPLRRAASLALGLCALLFQAGCPGAVQPTNRTEHAAKPAEAKPSAAEEAAQAAAPAALAPPTPPSPAAGQLAPPIRQIIVSYTGSSRAPKGLLRTKDEARARAEQALAKARKGADFEKLVLEYSDDAHKEQDHGFVGRMPPKTLFKDVYDKAIGLKANGDADVAESLLGFHVIKRED